MNHDPVFSVYNDKLPELAKRYMMSTCNTHSLNDSHLVNHVAHSISLLELIIGCMKKQIRTQDRRVHSVSTNLEQRIILFNAKDHSGRKLVMNSLFRHKSYTAISISFIS